MVMITIVKEVFYQDFITKLNKLDKKCLITELIKKPNFFRWKNII